jgi:site-specific DNA-cytosine methylase
MQMRVVDLFCGAGGFSYGMQAAGHHVVAAIDYEGRPLAVHAANVPAIRYRWGLRRLRYAVARDASWKGGHRRADLTDVLSMAPDIAELNPDVIVGGPPCQPWSKAGEEFGDADPRAKLTEAYGIIVATAKPRYFVLENVPEIQGSVAYRRMKHMVRRVGYALTEMVVNASEYGTAQSRDRFLCVGAVDEADGWFHDYMTEARSPRPMTVADILPDFGVELYRRDSRWVTTVDANHANPQRGRGYRLRSADIRVLEKAGDRFKAYWRYPGGPSSAGIRRTDEPMPTIIKSSAGGPGQAYKPRKGDVVDLRLLPIPSLDELSQIAGFPRGWDWKARESREKQASAGNDRRKTLSPIQMLANSVPPPLATAIGRALTAHAMKRIPVVERPDWQVPEAHVEWLARTRKLSQDMMTQEIAALREAKSYVCGHDLPDTKAEVAAFDKAAAIAHGALDAQHRAALRRALTNFAGWEANVCSLPSEREIKKLMKIRPYLRDCPQPLRGELAALEFDSEFQELPEERQAEWRQRVIALFEAGDPRPYSTSYYQSDDHYQEDDEDTSPPPLLLRRRAHA